MVVDAFHHYSGAKGERTRFQHVVDELQQSQDDDYILAVMQCFVSIINNATDLNTMLYFQMDLERAGLHDVLERLLRHSDVGVARLARDYQNKLLNVEDLMQERDRHARNHEEVSQRLAAVQDTATSVTQQRDELRQLHKDAQIRATDLAEQVANYRKESEALAAQLEEVSIKMMEQNALMLDQEKQLKEVEEHAMRTVGGWLQG